MEELLEILENIKPGVDFEEEDNLIEDEVLDSFDIVSLVSQIKSEFDVDITPADLIPENFKDAKSIYALIERLEEE